MFNNVVCQADKKVSCQPATKVQIHGKTKLKAPCVTTASFKTQAVCSFSPPLWNLGATCIKNTVHNDKHPQCSDAAGHKAAIATIDKVCRLPREGEDKLCSRLGMVY